MAIFYCCWFRSCGSGFGMVWQTVETHFEVYIGQASMLGITVAKRRNIANHPLMRSSVLQAKAGIGYCALEFRPTWEIARQKGDVSQTLLSHSFPELSHDSIVIVRTMFDFLCLLRQIILSLLGWNPYSWIYTSTICISCQINK